VNTYAIALFLHLLSLLLATAATAMHVLAALRLRIADSTADAMFWHGLIGKIVRAFPIAVIGLLASGIYMLHQRWNWSVPWIDAALVGLGLIVALGSGVEGSRARALKRSLEAEGMTERTRRLLRDPVAWTAKMMTMTLLVGVVFVMTVKPAAGGCAVAIVVAVLTGAVGAIPLWRVADANASEPTEGDSASR
jgi:hypothetical protein